MCGITGYDEQELTALTFQDITHPDDLDTDLNEATRLLNGEISSYQMDKRYFSRDGHLIWIHLSGSIVRDADDQPLIFVAHVEDISARKRDEELLRRQATRDSLTGVFNRSRFEEELARYQSLARRHAHQEEAAVLMIDLDGLKQVNDADGHLAGDDYLKAWPKPSADGCASPMSSPASVATNSLHCFRTPPLPKPRNWPGPWPNRWQPTPAAASASASP